jgi:hypothetical protein
MVSSAPRSSDLRRPGCHLTSTLCELQEHLSPATTGEMDILGYMQLGLAN